LVTLALSAGGCSTDRIFGSSPTPEAAGAARSSPSFGDRISNLFGNRTTQAEPQASGTPPVTIEEIDCPTVTVRPGTSTFAVSAPGSEPSVLTLRYQATFAQFARECKLNGTTLTIKVGVEGRVILGPAGGPGQLELPLRYAVVQEGPDPKTVITKLRWVQVPVPDGVTNVPFSVVEDELSFPLPRRHELDAFVIYVGFDREAMKEPARKRPSKPPARPARRPG
jgi:hypothetical protein